MNYNALLCAGALVGAAYAFPDMHAGQGLGILARVWMTLLVMIALWAARRFMREGEELKSRAEEVMALGTHYEGCVFDHHSCAVVALFAERDAWRKDAVALAEAINLSNACYALQYGSDKLMSAYQAHTALLKRTEGET